MRVLSLFDGMACGMLAMMQSSVDVSEYHAYEIDQYAIKTATHNFPMIQEHGDVFTADFTQYRDFDFLVGGSPCTYWSIAQTKNRETEASGLGWELFSQYVRALHEAKPRYFIYENNKSMAKAIRDQIRATFGFEEICINSALVSAQNRQRYYWVGKRNEDGTYSKVDVQQPDDLGILLKDVLDAGTTFYETQNHKSFALVSSYHKTGEHPFGSFGNEQRRQRVAEPASVCALPCEWDSNSVPTKAVSGADGKTYTVYPVQDGQITIKGKTYPIKLVDGYYIIRKLTVSECKRLQTVPDWYEFPVSNTQAYKMLGNGWTVDVIAHLINACLEEMK